MGRLEPRKAIASILQRLVAGRTYTVRRGLAKGLKRRGGLGFVPQVRLPPDEAFLHRLDLAGMTIYDIGAHVGVFTLFFARHVGPTGHVVAFEPNPLSYERVCENVSLNGLTNVDVRPVALGVRPGRAMLIFPADQPARGSLARRIQDRLLRERRVVKIEVDVDSVDHQISRGLQVPDFMKVDVEGLEFDVLAGSAELIARRHPTLYIEIHGPENARSIIEYLWLVGYQIEHVETGVRIDDPSKMEVAHGGHLHCE